MEGIAHNPPALKQRNGRENNPRSSSEAVARRARRGFNLIEAAIVLAVVGLVIGGIWVAASAVTENRRANETASGMLYTLEGIRNIYKGQHVTTNDSLNEFIFTAGLVPRNWGEMRWSGFYNQNFPYPESYIGAQFVIGADSAKIMLRIYGVTSASVCNRIIRAIGSKITSQTRLSEIIIARGGGEDTYTYPVDFTNLTCPSNVSLVAFLFHI